MFKCPGCGANIDFEPGLQQMKCPYCDTLVSAEDEIKVNSAENKTDYTDEEDTIDLTLYTCPQCGGELLSEATTAVTFCSYCGSSTPLTGRLSKERRPYYIVPFKNTKEQCVEIYKNLLKKSYFVPEKLKENAYADKLRGIYMPYWIYHVGSSQHLKSTAKRSQVNGDVVTTIYYDVEGTLDLRYDGVTFDGSSSFYDYISSNIMPYEREGMVPFNINYLSGFYADTADIKAETYDSDAKKAVSEHISGTLWSKMFAGYEPINEKDEEKLINEDDMSIENRKLALFPVWFVANRYGDRVCYAAVNGQTGKISAQLPVDKAKYVGTSLLISAVIFVFLTAFSCQFNPGLFLTLALILSFVYIVNINTKANEAFWKDTGYLDKGVKSKLADYERAMANYLYNQAQADLKRKTRIMKLTIGALGAISTIGINFLLLGFEILPFIYSMNMTITVILVMVGIVVTKCLTSMAIEFPTMPSAPLKNKLPVLIKPALSILTAIVITIINPVRDIWYYAAGILMIVMLVFATLDMINLQNKISTRHLPQFNKRGGDEDESI